MDYLVDVIMGWQKNPCNLFEEGQRKEERIKWISKNFPGPLISCSYIAVQELSSWKKQWQGAFYPSDLLSCFGSPLLELYSFHMHVVPWDSPFTWSHFCEHFTTISKLFYAFTNSHTSRLTFFLFCSFQW